MRCWGGYRRCRYREGSHPEKSFQRSTIIEDMRTALIVSAVGFCIDTVQKGNNKPYQWTQIYLQYVFVEERHWTRYIPIHRSWPFRAIYDSTLYPLQDGRQHRAALIIGQICPSCIGYCNSVRGAAHQKNMAWPNPYPFQSRVVGSDHSADHSSSTPTMSIPEYAGWYI